MKFEKLVPNVYYNNINDGLKFFTGCLEFSIAHDEIKSSEPFCVLAKDGLQLFLFESAKLAKEHNPEFRIVTKDIETIYAKVAASHPEFLHPNLNKITLRPWGAKEFALRDDQVCIIFQEW